MQAATGLGIHHIVERPPAEESAADLRAESFYGALRLLEEQAQEPLLLLFDDLHWSDPDSLALLFFLCRRIAGLRVGLMATLRPWPPAAEEMVSKLAHSNQAV